MRHHTVLLLAVLAAQSYSETLHSDNGMPWRGVWGNYDECPYTSDLNNTYAYALDFKYDDLDDVDFIGGDSVKLFCRDDNNGISGYISSLQGTHGEWQGIRSCPDNEYFIGFRLRVFPEQGTFGDDFAVDNIQLACSDGTVVDGLDGVTPPAPDFVREGDDMNVMRKWTELMGRRVEVLSHRRDTREARLNGLWGTWAYCSPGLYVMAIETVVEEGHVGDDAGLTEVTLYCY